MIRRKKHRHGLEDLLQRYARSRYLDIKRYNNGAQIAIIDRDYSRIDIWLTGKYHIIYTNYWRITRHTVRPRRDERGELPIPKVELGRFLDKVFFVADAIEERG